MERQPIILLRRCSRTTIAGSYSFVYRILSWRQRSQEMPAQLAAAVCTYVANIVARAELAAIPEERQFAFLDAFARDLAADLSRRAAESASRPQPPRQPWLLPLLQQHIVTLMLLLGAGFLFTSALVFLRTRWQQYKIHIFVGFVLLTLGCFIAGYLARYSRKKISGTVAITLLLVACLFFPLNFFFRSQSRHPRRPWQSLSGAVAYRRFDCRSCAVAAQ